MIINFFPLKRESLLEGGGLIEDLKNNRIECKASITWICN